MPMPARSLAGAHRPFCRVVVLLLLLSPLLLASPKVTESAIDPGVAVRAIGTASRSGAAEIPGPGDSDGTGTAQVQVNVGAQQVCIALNGQNIAPATAAHIHRGVGGVAGPIVVTLPTPVGGVANGCVAVHRFLASEILLNPAGFYVNVHTADFPDGAIRGQVALSRPTNLVAALTGAAEVPPADPDGSGLAAVTVDRDTLQVCAVLNVANIDPAILAHIHRGVAGVIGPIVIDLPVPTAGSANGCTTGLSAALLDEIVNNPAGFYVNVHTGTFTGGAIRGQLQVAAPATQVAALTGAAEVPGPGDLDGLGLSSLSIDVPNRRICIATLVENVLTPIAAHIHGGPAGVSGPIVVNLPIPVNGAVVGCVEGINAALIAQIASNPSAFYVNVHTIDHTSGAIRGQLVAIAAVLPGPPPPAASVGGPPAVSNNDANNDDEPRPETREQRQQRELTNRSNRDDVKTEGDVVETHCDDPIPHVVIATRDGNVTIHLLHGIDRLCSSIQIGAYITVDGAKQHEFLYEAEDVDIVHRH